MLVQALSSGSELGKTEMITKIISGGQTGADRATLDSAIKHGFPHGGWIPKGRLAEDGPLPAKYKLKEMPTSSYPAQTEQNVIDSDGTLIISHGKLGGGADLTKKTCNRAWSVMASHRPEPNKSH